MRVSRTRFSKRRLKRKTEFPIVAVVQKKRKIESGKSSSFGILSQKAGTPKQGSKEPSFSKGVKGLERKQSGQNKSTLSPQKKSRASIDYKNVILLRNLITAEGKILPRRINKLTAKQQRSVQKAIKSARIMGLIPFINKSRPF